MPLAVAFPLSKKWRKGARLPGQVISKVLQFKRVPLLLPPRISTKTRKRRKLLSCMRRQQLQPPPKATYWFQPMLRWISCVLKLQSFHRLMDLYRSLKQLASRKMEVLNSLMLKAINWDNQRVLEGLRVNKIRTTLRERTSNHSKKEGIPFSNQLDSPCSIQSCNSRPLISNSSSLISNNKQLSSLRISNSFSITRCSMLSTASLKHHQRLKITCSSRLLKLLKINSQM